MTQILHAKAEVADAALWSVNSDGSPSVRAAFGCFPTGVVVVSALGADAQPHLIVASSFQVGISLEPPIVLVSVQKTSTSFPQLRAASRLGVSVLGAQHAQNVHRLAGKGADRFEGTSMLGTSGGAQFVRGATVSLETSIYDEYPVGDHDLVLLEVHGMAIESDLAPLIWHRSTFHGLAQVGGDS